MQVFYGKEESGLIKLNQEESKHLSRVLRKVPGDPVSATDGEGHFYECEVELADKQESVLKVLERHFDDGRPKVKLYIAPTKNISRMEWLLEKAVELGLGEMQFVRCDNSERKKLRLDRLEKIALSAMKQSQRVYLPKLHEMMSFDKALASVDPKHAFLAHCYSDLSRTSLKEHLDPAEDISLFIGPEGDFSRKEVDLATSKGIRCIHLGESRLRTETAALYGLSILKLNQEQ